MTTLVFVLVWVVLGLGLLFIAMSGGTSGAAERVMSTSRTGRRVATVLFVISAVLLGVVIPGAVIAAIKDKDDIPEANVSDLTESEKHGRELFGLRCANCHTLQAANAIAEVGPNLDQIRPNKATVLNAIENGKSAGNGQMAAGLYTGQDAEDVANFVAKAVGSTETPAEAEDAPGASEGDSDDG
jgi:mono/diheme cytochrome c family protein